MKEVQNSFLDKRPDHHHDHQDHVFLGAEGSDLTMCTEILGSESGDFMVAETLWTEMADEDVRSGISSSSSSSSALKLRTTSSMLRKQRLMKNLAPMLPLLSTLDMYGRPRFTLERKTRMMSEGRLLISIDKEQRPRAVPPNGKRRSTSSSISKKLVLSYNSDSDDEEDNPEDSEKKREDLSN
ncbi:hypothetical protein Pyn_31731 [Prunus yedoensis var. nudiflora]|uniref:Uncharacterized protein n=1 Tax=Prunus yedoensis var. nudiflora TaxID=2094558 RepID=A0A314UJI4_PRUYE|nr:hypothetical protein Pyn_31731 [Prunus yedoensis var. nudiflora]